MATQRFGSINSTGYGQIQAKHERFLNDAKNGMKQ